MRRALTLAAAFLCTAAPAQADTICEWMDFGAKIETASTPPGLTTRTGEHERALTQAALAMFEATNAIDRRYESYLGLPRGNPAASQDVAAATAAYHVLSAHFPEQKKALDESYAMALQAAGDAAARDAGQAAGQGRRRGRPQGRHHRSVDYPGSIPAPHPGRSLGAGPAAGFRAVVHGSEAVGHRPRRCRPPGPAPRGDQRTLRPRPRRSETARQQDQQGAHAASDLDGPLPDHRRT